jgi:hypothetical protein
MGVTSLRRARTPFDNAPWAPLSSGEAICRAWPVVVAT